MKRGDIKYIAFGVGYYLLWVVLVGLSIRFVEIFFYPSWKPRWPTDNVLILAAIIAGVIIVVQLKRRMR